MSDKKKPYEITLTPHPDGRWGWRTSRRMGEGGLFVVGAGVEPHSWDAEFEAQYSAKRDAVEQQTVPRPVVYDYDPGV